VTTDLERPKVVLFVWVIRMAEIVIHANRLHDARDCFGAQAGNASRHQRRAGCEVLPQFIVERTIRALTDRLAVGRVAAGAPNNAAKGIFNANWLVRNTRFLPVAGSR
jgi:hypothetical protein